MPLSDPIDLLLSHDVWASQNILRACEALSEEQFHRRFEMGPGSLHATMLHVIHAKRGWGDLLAGREFTKLDPEQRKTPAELLAMLQEVSADFDRSARAHPLTDTVTRERGGKVYTFTRGAVITHVTTHAMHHRAQCLNMLRQLRVNPLPPSSVIEMVRDQA